MDLKSSPPRPGSTHEAEESPLPELAKEPSPQFVEEIDSTQSFQVPHWRPSPQSPSGTFPN